MNFNFHTNNTHSSLHHTIILGRGYRRPDEGFFLRAESFYNVATQLERYEKNVFNPYRYYGGKSLHQQSHGESFLTLIQNRFNQNSLYILDEPEASLSPQRQLTLLITIYELAKQGSQFIIASHSPILLGIPGAKILNFDSKEITPIDYHLLFHQKQRQCLNHDHQFFQNQLMFLYIMHYVPAYIFYLANVLTD